MTSPKLLILCLLGWFSASAVLVTGAETADAPAGLEAWLDPEGSLWTMTAAQFMAAHAGQGFAWGSQTRRDTARAANPALAFFGLQVWEAIVRFDDHGVTEVTLSLYNRGDAGDIEEAAFDKLLATVDQRLNDWTGSKPVEFREQDRTAAVPILHKAWVKPPHRLDLIWSFTSKSHQQNVSAPRPEYARLQLTRYDPARDPRKTVFGPVSAPAMPLSTLELKARVHHTPNGEVVVTGDPMVDQGRKGYCAAAVAERMLRYYGRKVDQHEIAQLANTSATGGTSPDGMITALRRIGSETGLQVTVLQHFEFREFEKLIKDYNHAAKKAHKMEVDLGAPAAGRVIDIGEIYKEFDPVLLREARLKRDAAMAQFKTQVARFIDNGVPIVWAVELGKIPETPPVTGIGGHMRLIIGYNSKNGEILYTDTWGPGHEQKHMSLGDAWTITLGLYTVLPGNLRL